MKKSDSAISRVRLAACVAALALAGCSSMGSMAAAHQSLAGAQEVPAVDTSAAGKGDIAIADDGSVSGAVTTTGVAGTMAHIHMAAPGVNGPVIVPLAKTADNTWSVPAGAKLTAEQLAAYRAGNLYVNVHSAAHPGGEIRAQLKP